MSPPTVALQHSPLGEQSLPALRGTNDQSPRVVPRDKFAANRGAAAGSGAIASATSATSAAPSATEARRRVDPGNARRRPAGWRRRRARARGGAALLALSRQRGTLVLTRLARHKRRKPRVLKFVAHFAFGRSFSSRCSKGFKMGARACDRRCCTLNSHCLYHFCLSSSVADLLALESFGF